MSNADSSLEDTGIWNIASNPTDTPKDDEALGNVSIEEDVGVRIPGRVKTGQEKSFRQRIQEAFSSRLDGFVALYIDSDGKNTLVRASLEHGTDVQRARFQIRAIMKDLGANFLDE